MNDLITVIINVYNGEKYIKKCIESIINQTYKNLEILVIDDGSTDNTLSIIKEYKDKRIRIISTENKGLSMSRNVGIENALGNYLYFIDSDDFIEKDTIEYLYKLIKKYDVNISTCKPMAIYNYDYKVRKIKEKIKLLDSFEMLKNVLLAIDSTGTTWNKLYKKELFSDIRFENRIINDIVTTYKLVLKSKKIVYSNQKKYYYLKHKDSITTKENSLDRTKDFFDASIERYNYIKKIYPKFNENDFGLVKNIVKLYLTDDEENLKYLDSNALDYFNKLFSFKILFCKLNAKDKIKIILFKMSPKLYKKIVRRYRLKKY